MAPQPATISRCHHDRDADLCWECHRPPRGAREAIYSEINAERAFQDKKWGVQRHEDGKWFRILMEEVGEASRASLERDRAGLKSELTQAAAVIVAFLECIQDRELYSEVA